MDLTLYPKVKKDGAGLVKVGGAYAIAMPRFDQATGKPVPPDIIAVDREQIAAMRARLNEQLAALDAVEADMSAEDAKAAGGK